MYKIVQRSFLLLVVYGEMCYNVNQCLCAHICVIDYRGNQDEG